MFCHPIKFDVFRALADTDADGKMDLIEFSIACKLISLKLRNVEVPKLLPPTLVASLKHIGTPIRTPTGAMSPTEGYKQFITQPNVQQQQMMQGQPLVQPQAQMVIQPTMVQNPPMPIPTFQQYQQQPEILSQQPLLMSQPQMIPQQQMVPPQQMVAPQMAQVPVALPTQIPQQIVAPQMVQQFIPQQIAPPVMPVMAPQQFTQAMPPLVNQQSNGSLLESLIQVQPMVAATGPLPATPTPPQSGNASRSMSFSEKAPSVPESP